MDDLYPCDGMVGYLPRCGRWIRCCTLMSAEMIAIERFWNAVAALAPLKDAVAIPLLRRLLLEYGIVEILRYVFLPDRFKS